MEQSQLIAFEQGVDQFMGSIKAYLLHSLQAHVHHCLMPQCLDCFIVTDENDQQLTLRLVLLSYSSRKTLARLSWLDKGGQDHVCCYLNSQFEAIRRKCNGEWVRDKHSPQAMCVLQWTALHDPSVQC